MTKHVRSGPGYHVGLARHDFVINSHIHQKDTTQTFHIQTFGVTRHIVETRNYFKGVMRGTICQYKNGLS